MIKFKKIIGFILQATKYTIQDLLNFKTRVILSLYSTILLINHKKYNEKILKIRNTLKDIY